MESKWVVYGKKADFKAIGEQFNIDQVIARVIRNRDVIGDDAIDMYLRGSLKNVHNPALMADMEKGCQIIRDKIIEKKHIRIISDYDVDGVMSNYILLKGLMEAGALVSYEIPDRMQDGYGINERIIRDAYEAGVDTIITCDNGIAAFSAVELGKELGMTIVVTDHHEVPYEVDENGEKHHALVPADAVIDIKRVDCGYPYKGLCGAGVAYKFIRHLYKLMDIDWPDEGKYLEMLAIATQCDVMELTDENRIYVKEGLKLLARTANLGLQALLEVNQLKGKPLYSYHLGFVIGPCINATGRLESAKRGLELLLCEDKEKAYELADELKQINITRKDMTNKGVDDAIALVNSNDEIDNVLVIYMPALHESLAGIVAGRIRETFYRPVFVITDGEGDMVKGSGRSIEGYHMYDALTECKDLLTKYGGHELAAGFSLEKRNLEAFKKRLLEKQKLTEDELTPVVRIDVPMPLSYITPKLVDELALLEPFGKGNEKPVFAQAGLGVKSARLMGAEGRFIRIYFQDEHGFVMEGIDFNANKFIDYIKMWFSDEECDKMLSGLPNNIKIDVAYYPDINEYNGRCTLQIKPVLYRKSQC